MRPIHIIGGGLAGLALGITLRERSVPVTITEAGSYPRHRVCGEFISGRGVEILRQLAGTRLLDEGRPRVAQSAAFFLRDRCLGVRHLPHPALCISRHALDALLARRFSELGGDLQVRTRAALPDASRQKSHPEGVVFATGRRRDAVDANGWRWFGLKAHFSKVDLAADLEMHLDGNAYVGICRLSDGTVNVCGLFRRKEGEAKSSDPMADLRGAPGTLLHARLRNAQVHEQSVCAVAALNATAVCGGQSECRIGDAWTMIPPITGNGMSMALESAGVAVAPLTAYAGGGMAWPCAVAEVENAMHGAFRSRLRWAAILHRLLFGVARRSSLAPPLYRMTWRAAFALTR